MNCGPKPRLIVNFSQLISRQSNIVDRTSLAKMSAAFDLMSVCEGGGSQLNKSLSDLRRGNRLSKDLTGMFDSPPSSPTGKTVISPSRAKLEIAWNEKMAAKKQQPFPESPDTVATAMNFPESDIGPTALPTPPPAFSKLGSDNPFLERDRSSRNSKGGETVLANLPPSFLTPAPAPSCPSPTPPPVMTSPREQQARIHAARSRASVIKAPESYPSLHDEGDQVRISASGDVSPADYLRVPESWTAGEKEREMLNKKEMLQQAGDTIDAFEEEASPLRKSGSWPSSRARTIPGGDPSSAEHTAGLMKSLSEIDRAADEMIRVSVAEHDVEADERSNCSDLAEPSHTPPPSRPALDKQDSRKGSGKRLSLRNVLSALSSRSSSSKS